MKTLLVFAGLLCIAAAAPADDPTKQVPEVPAEVQMKEVPAVPEVPAEVQMKEVPAVPEVPAEVQMKEVPAVPEVPAEVQMKEVPAVPEVAAEKPDEEKPADDLMEEPQEEVQEEEVLEEEVPEQDLVTQEEGSMMEEVLEEEVPEEDLETQEENIMMEEAMGNKVELAPRNDLVLADPEMEETVDQDPNSRFFFCPAGWFRLGSRCFLMVSTRKSWYNAEDHCRDLGANLASVSDPREYRFLQQLTQTASQTTAWLGGFNLQGRWMWINRQGFFYTNWYGQASVASYPCLFLRSTNGWGNSNCGTSLPFICAASPGSC